MDIEDYLSDLMEQGAAEALAGVDVDALVREGERLGMQMHRRRRNRIAFGTAAAVVALGAGTAAALTVGAPARDSTVASPTAHRAPSASASSYSATPAITPTPTSTPTQPMTHRVPVTYKDVLTTFTKLAPAGIKVGLDPSTPDSVQTAKFTNLRIDDGHGAAVVFIGVGTQAEIGGGNCPANWQSTDEGPRPAGALPIGCSSQTLPDGDQLLQIVTGDDGYGYYDLEVTLVRQDGVAVSLSVGNGYLGTKVPVTVTRAQPPLSVTQVDAIVESRLWQTTVAVPGPA